MTNYSLCVIPSYTTMVFTPFSIIFSFICPSTCLYNKLLFSCVKIIEKIMKMQDRQLNNFTKSSDEILKIFHLAPSHPPHTKKSKGKNYRNTNCTYFQTEKNLKIGCAKGLNLQPLSLKPVQAILSVLSLSLLLDTSFAIYLHFS